MLSGLKGLVGPWLSRVKVLKGSPNLIWVHPNTQLLRLPRESPVGGEMEMTASFQE